MNITDWVKEKKETIEQMTLSTFHVSGDDTELFEVANSLPTALKVIERYRETLEYYEDITFKDLRCDYGMEAASVLNLNIEDIK